MAQRVPLSFLTSDAPTRPVVVIADSNPFSELVYTAPPSPFDPWSDVGNFYRDNYPPVIAPPPAPMGSGTGVGALAAILRIVYAEDTNKVFRATV